MGSGSINCYHSHRRHGILIFAEGFFPEALRLGFPLVVFVATGTARTLSGNSAGAHCYRTTAGMEYSFSPKDFHYRRHGVSQHQLLP